MDGNWISTYSGKRFKFESVIDPATIDIDDIAHSLSMQCRFNGHTREFYSVAEHSLIMSFMVEVEAPFHIKKEASLYALLHDAAGAYVEDIVTPLKTDEMRMREDVIMSAIVSRFALKLSAEVIAEVKKADLRMLATEVNQLMYPGHHYPQLRGINPYKIQLRTWQPKEAMAAFECRYHELTGGRHGD